MKGVKVVNCRKEPFPHDHFLNRVVLWIFPLSVKPNHITIFRLLATPFIWALVIFELWSIVIPAFLIVAFTDALDGSMARIRGQITSWGTLFDPVADKLLIGGVLFILILKYINMWIGGAVIALEFIVIIAGILNRKNGIVISASIWGKTKMLLQVTGVTMLLYSLLVVSHDAMIIAEWTLILSIVFAILNLTWKGARGI